MCEVGRYDDLESGDIHPTAWRAAGGAHSRLQLRHQSLKAMHGGAVLQGTCEPSSKVRVSTFFSAASEHVAGATGSRTISAA